MPKDRSDPKLQSLREHGILNVDPDRVSSRLFQEGDFFDPRDLVQVKYEMVRLVRVDGESVSQAAVDFGFSRPSFYEAQSAFESMGLWGLLPKKRGPHGGHKLTPEILAFVARALDKDSSLEAATIAALLKQRFSVVLHPRTIERAVLGQKKKHR